MRVEKWQALGNHFLVVERAALPFPLTPARARLLCDAARGPGADGVLEVSVGGAADVEVVVHNRDGSVAEVSGNGTRIAVAYAAERLGRDELSVRTGAGKGRARRRPDGWIGVTMGRAALDGRQYAPVGDGPGREHRFVSIGNPHCVIEVDDVAAFPLEHEGPAIEHHAWFPERTNVEVVRVGGRHDVTMRVWERGVGETQACGSGAVATAVAAVVDGRCESPVRVAMPGGSVEVVVDGALDVELVGTAARVYTAELDPAFVAELEAVA
jgi:diaminopimelate epimerase